jgi:methylenetetrahydrofolate reductase (NADPH)
MATMEGRLPVDVRLAALLREPRYEVIPVRGIEDRISALPAGSQVTVTASPALGLSRTVDAAVLLAASGHHVTPHLAARMLRGPRELGALVERLADAGIGEAFVIGGDASPPAGPYRDAADLLDELGGLGHPFTRIGIGAYPEGHPLVTDESLLESLRRKQPQADYLVTQLCFDGAAFAAWLGAMRAEGVTLPVSFGLPGVVERRKLAEISLKSGVGASLRYLRKNGRQMARLARSRRYDPTPLLRSVVAAVDGQGLPLEGVHLFTFNQIEATAAWVQDLTRA